MDSESSGLVIHKEDSTSVSVMALAPALLAQVAAAAHDPEEGGEENGCTSHSAHTIGSVQKRLQFIHNVRISGIGHFDHYLCSCFWLGRKFSLTIAPVGEVIKK